MKYYPGIKLILPAILAIMAFGSGYTAAQTTEPVVTHHVVMKTSMGTVEMELYGNDAPKTVENFVTLIRRGFYKGLLFHRVIQGFVIQAGDPQTRNPSLSSVWGTGGESIYKGNEFEDELNPAKPSYKRGYIEGAVAMANRGPNTNTSQFFIMLVDGKSFREPMQKIYTIFGRITKGMDVVHAIGAVDTHEGSGLPQSPVTILEATVTDVPAPK